MGTTSAETEEGGKKEKKMSVIFKHMNMNIFSSNNNIKDMHTSITKQQNLHNS